MTRFIKIARCVLAACLLGTVGVLAACDTVEPTEGPVLVLEGFLDTGKPLPNIRLRQTKPIAQLYADNGGTAVSDASVNLSIGGEAVTYRPVSGSPGEYEPVAGAVETVPERSPFSIAVQWYEQLATSSGYIPPAIQIDHVDVNVAEKPVKAVLLDSLLFDPSRIDSLRLDSLGTGQTFVYPVEVTVHWTTEFAEAGADSAYWVRTQLKPPDSISSERINFFLRPEQIQRERRIPRDAAFRRKWTGVYAVPVTSEEDPLPAHQLRIGLIRSGRDYARFASSRDAPDRREPISNVKGGIGIVSGISLDTLIVEVVGTLRVEG